MAVRREDVALKMEDPQIGCSWVPATPAKPNSTNQQPICTSWKGKNYPVQTNRPESERCKSLTEPGILPGEFLQGTHCRTALACCSSGNIVDVDGGSSNWQSRGATDSSVREKGVYSGNLLALAHSEVVATSSCKVHFHPVSEGSQFTISFGNPSLREQENMLAEKSDSIPNVFTNGSSVPSRHSIDLNLPPVITDAASNRSGSFQFEAMTPHKNYQDEYRMSSIPFLGTAGVPAAKDQENKITSDGLKENHGKKGKSRFISNLLSVTSTPLQENHKPDKGGTDQADLIKTPPQKARRTKHRPKVIIEGQHTKTPKSSARKSNVPQDPTRVKRKYVRRKGINNVLEVGTDLDRSMSKEVREKGIDKLEGSMDNGTSGTAARGPSQRTRSSCRRSLNFHLEGQEKEASSSTCNPSSHCNRGSQAENSSPKDQSSMNVQCAQGIEVMSERRDTGIAHQPHHSANQVHEVSKERLDPSPSPCTIMHPLMNYTLTNQIACTRVKCQIVFSDETHEKEINTVRMGMNSEKQRMEKSLNDAICSSTRLTPERQSITATAEVEACNKVETGTDYNPLKSYTALFSQNADKDNGTFRLHFPSTCKKRRTGNRYNMATSNFQYTASIIGNRAKLERCTLRDSRTNFFIPMTHVIDGIQNERQVFEDKLVLRTPVGIKKTRSKGRKRIQDVSSLLIIPRKLPASPGTATKSRIEQGIDIPDETPKCLEVLVAGTHSMITTKKRSKSIRINSIVQYNHQQFSALSIGPPLALTWKCMPSVDSITEQLNRLDLNADSIQGLSKNHNALMEYDSHYPEQHSLVPFQKYGAVVPFDSSLDQIRRQARPKVDLDDETTRVWKLLLENINSEGIDGTDEENRKWWEEERRVFGGRANSFIARMRLVQGDRHFSPWKGSVVDSVVGVFLTQNVSDHLSSSAFMSLVAQFPVDSKTHHSDFHEAKVATKIKEPEVYNMDPGGTSQLNKKRSKQSVYVEDEKTLPDYDSEKEVDGIQPFGNGFNGSALEDNSRGQSTESSKCDPVMYNENVADKSDSSIEDGRDIEDTFSSQKLVHFTIEPIIEKSDSCSRSSTSEEPAPGLETNRFTSSTSFVKLLQRAGSILNGVYERGTEKKLSDQNWQGQSERITLNFQNCKHLDNATLPAKPVAGSIQSISCHASNSGGQATQDDLSDKTSTFFKCSREKELHAVETSKLSSEFASQAMSQKIKPDSFLEGPYFSSSNAQSNKGDQVEMNQTAQELTNGLFQGNNFETQVSEAQVHPQNMEVRGVVSNLDNSISEDKDYHSKNDPDYHIGKPISEPRAKRGRTRKRKGKGKEKQVKWNHLRNQALTGGRERVRTANTLDSVNWDAIRCTDVNEIAETIKERGMNNMLAQRIKDFLNRLVRDHGSIDLEWLRDVPPDKAKEYLLSIRGLGLKSVECVRLLTLHHVAFPVDTNVGRIAVRLGWVPLQPLPESLQLHLLELYPVLESIQKYLWPRLCKLDQGTLYELHYQMITFGKVFCTKSKPNCNACPMRGECRHFASAFASARFALPESEEKRIVCATENRTTDHANSLCLPQLQANQMNVQSGAIQPIIEEPPSPEPIIEVPATPEPVYKHASEGTIESTFYDELEEIPNIQLNMEEFTHNLQEIMQQNTQLQEGDMSKALVALTSEAASIPVPKLKHINRLRTEHRVYELPDTHPLLEEMEKREPDDPCPYLLAIWTPGETVDSIKPPAKRCRSQGLEKLCTDETCSSCNSIREANSQTVRGTLLIPCKTAMRGSFPLNGTYFQVNEVFSDHESSLSPLDVPRAWLWNLPRRTVFFGTSIPTIFRGLSTEGIQYCFWRGFVCVRGFDRKTRAPRPLVARLHFPASRLVRRKGNMDDEYP